MTENIEHIFIVFGNTNDDKGNISDFAKTRLDLLLEAFGQRPNSKILLTGGKGEFFNKTDKPHA